MGWGKERWWLALVVDSGWVRGGFLVAQWVFEDTRK